MLFNHVNSYVIGSEFKFRFNQIYRNLFQFIRFSYNSVGKFSSIGSVLFLKTEQNFGLLILIRFNGTDRLNTPSGWSIFEKKKKIGGRFVETFLFKGINKNSRIICFTSRINSEPFSLSYLFFFFHREKIIRRQSERKREDRTRNKLSYGD